MNVEIRYWKLNLGCLIKSYEERQMHQFSYPKRMQNLHLIIISLTLPYETLTIA